MKTVLSQKVAEKKLIVVDSLNMDAISTKNALAALNAIKATGKVSVVYDDTDVNFVYSAGNLENVTLLGLGNVSVYDVLYADVVVMAKESVKALEGGLK